MSMERSFINRLQLAALKGLNTLDLGLAPGLKVIPPVYSPL